MEYALISYMYTNQKVSLQDYLKDNWIGVLLFITAVFSALRLRKPGRLQQVFSRTVPESDSSGGL